MGKKFLFCMAWFLCVAAMTFAAGKKFTLVIDAGHGGKDAGCIGAISKEKNLALRYALAFGRYVEEHCPDVRVVYTRKTDTFLELWQRAEIANKAKADLFISIHINSVSGSKSVKGYQTYTLGKGRSTGTKKGIYENLEVAKRENAVMVMEKDYKQRYAGFDDSAESSIMFGFIQDKNMEQSVELARLMQRNVCAATGRADKGAHQDNLAVLRLTSMPGCLLELGFISTPEEENFLNAQESTAKYVKGIYKAFMAYKEKFFKGVIVPYKAPQEAVSSPTSPKPVAETVKKTTAEPVFKVQILTSDKQLKEGDSQFKGQKGIESFKEGGIIKYTMGASANYNEIYSLRKSLLDKFPSAFIIAFRNGEKMDVREAIKEYKVNRGIK